MANAALLPEVTALLEKGHSVTLPLRGYSMRPFLEDGRDKALLVKADIGRLKRGDVVLAEVAPEKYVLHRLISISAGHVVLLGDGNITPEYCLADDIRAVAVAFCRKGRTRPDAVTSAKWRIYSWLWMALRPLRRWLLAVYRRL